MAFVGRSRHQNSSRDSAPGPRFVVFALLSVVCLYYDQRDGWLQSLRYWLQGSVYPLQWLVDAPRIGLQNLGDALESRDSLRAEIARLQQRSQSAAPRSVGTRKRAIARAHSSAACIGHKAPGCRGDQRRTQSAQTAPHAQQGQA
ncbi:MAG: hypothetical protein NT064_08040 [Proteobacteria bacterium]|nr:hypothetical protein [Pseudomonadota bacterium]